MVCRHAPMCLAYMAQLRDRDIFRFCAIPQVMAIGTLALCYDNHAVFTGAPSSPHPWLAGCHAFSAAQHRRISPAPFTALRGHSKVRGMLDVCSCVSTY